VRQLDASSAQLTLRLQQERAARGRAQQDAGMGADPAAAPAAPADAAAAAMEAAGMPVDAAGAVQLLRRQLGEARRDAEVAGRREASLLQELAAANQRTARHRQAAATLTQQVVALQQLLPGHALPPGVAALLEQAPWPESAAPGAALPPPAAAEAPAAEPAPAPLPAQAAAAGKLHPAGRLRATRPVFRLAVPLSAMASARAAAAAGSCAEAVGDALGEEGPSTTDGTGGDATPTRSQHRPAQLDQADGVAGTSRAGAAALQGGLKGRAAAAIAAKQPPSVTAAAASAQPRSGRAAAAVQAALADPAAAGAPADLPGRQQEEAGGRKQAAEALLSAGALRSRSLDLLSPQDSARGAQWGKISVEDFGLGQSHPLLLAEDASGARGGVRPVAGRDSCVGAGRSHAGAPAAAASRPVGAHADWVVLLAWLTQGQAQAVRMLTLACTLLPAAWLRCERSGPAPAPPWASRSGRCEPSCGSWRPLKPAQSKAPDNSSAQTRGCNL